MPVKMAYCFNLKPAAEWYLTDYLPSQKVTQGYYKEGNYARIEAHERPDQKMFGLVGIPQLGRLRHQAMSSALQSRYYLRGRSP